MDETTINKFAELFADCAATGSVQALRKEAAEQALIKEALDPYSVLLPLGGAAAGGLTGYLGTRDPKRKTRNALYGALTGGLTGIGGRLVKNWYDNVTAPGTAGTAAADGAQGAAGATGAENSAPALKIPEEARGKAIDPSAPMSQGRRYAAVPAAAGGAAVGYSAAGKLLPGGSDGRRGEILRAISAGKLPQGVPQDIQTALKGLLQKWQRGDRPETLFSPLPEAPKRPHYTVAEMHKSHPDGPRRNEAGAVGPKAWSEWVEQRAKNEARQKQYTEERKNYDAQVAARQQKMQALGNMFGSQSGLSGFANRLGIGPARLANIGRETDGLRNHRSFRLSRADDAATTANRRTENAKVLADALNNQFEDSNKRIITPDHVEKFLNAAQQRPSTLRQKAVRGAARLGGAGLGGLGAAWAADAAGSRLQDMLVDYLNSQADGAAPQSLLPSWLPLPLGRAENWGGGPPAK